MGSSPTSELRTVLATVEECDANECGYLEERRVLEQVTLHVQPASDARRRTSEEIEMRYARLPGTCQSTIHQCLPVTSMDTQAILDLRFRARVWLSVNGISRLIQLPCRPMLVGQNASGLYVRFPFFLVRPSTVVDSDVMKPLNAPQYAWS